jgi:hypothetical protein
MKGRGTKPEFDSETPFLNKSTAEESFVRRVTPRVLYLDNRLHVP